MLKKEHIQKWYLHYFEIPQEYDEISNSMLYSRIFWRWIVNFHLSMRSNQTCEKRDKLLGEMVDP